MTYLEKAVLLEKVVRDGGRVVYHGETAGQYSYAVVTSETVEQGDFPEECTADASPAADYVVAMRGDFEDEQDVADALEYCGMYNGQ